MDNEIKGTRNPTKSKKGAYLTRKIPILTDEQIKHMRDRFLGWGLPENFNPDGGITFNPTINEGTPRQMKREPSGTNLFDAEQAEKMIRYMIEGLS